jgi:hypothetical protein
MIISYTKICTSEYNVGKSRNFVHSVTFVSHLNSMHFVTFVSHLNNTLLNVRDLACFCPYCMDYNSEFCNTQSCETMKTTKIRTSQCHQGISFEFTNHSLVLYRACMFGKWPIPILKNVFSNSITHVTLNFRKALIS